MVSCEIAPGVWLDGRLALWLATPRLLVVADLHWGYAASHQACGNLLPLWGDAELASRLRGLIADYRPAEMLWLGDSLHTLAGREPAENFLRETDTPIAVLSGNHDRRWIPGADPLRRGAPGRGSAQLPTTLVRGGYFFHHGHLAPELPADCVEIVGHHHPALGWYDGAGGRLKLPALVASPRRLILPAFSPWAAGTPWNHSLAENETLFAIAPKRIFAVSRSLLHNSRLSA
jgi:metallophosphoesterase superfamily enzyme